MDTNLEQNFLKSITKADEIRMLDGLYNLNDMGVAAQSYDTKARKDSRPAEWLRLKNTVEIIQELEVSGNSRSPIYRVITKGNNNQRGIWGNLDVAIAYLHWVSPKFAVHVNTTYRKLITGEYQVMKTSRDKTYKYAKQQEHRAAINTQAEPDTVSLRGFFFDRGYGNYNESQAKVLANRAIAYTYSYGAPIGDVLDSRYGTRHTYSKWILDKVFDDFINGRIIAKKYVGECKND